MARPAVVVILTVLAAVAFMTLPFALRSFGGNSSLIGQESYAYLLRAQGVLEPGSAPAPEVSVTLFDRLVAASVHLAGPLWGARLLLLVLGAGSTLFCVLAARKTVGEQDWLLACVFLVASPLLVTVHTTLSPFSLCLFLFSLSWLLLDRHPLLAAGVLLVLMGVHVWAFIAGAALLFAYGLLQDKWRAPLAAGGLGIVLIVALHATFGFLALDALVIDRGSMFVSLGGSLGYSFFLVFLALLGFLSSWSKDRVAIGASIVVAGVFVASWRLPAMRVVMVPAVALLAGRGAGGLVRRQWSVAMIKTATLFLIGLSVLFTLVMAIGAQAEAEPAAAQMQALRFLQTVPDDEVVLSAPRNGVLIEWVAHREAFLDDLAKDPAVAAHKQLVAAKIFQGQRMTPTAQLLEEQCITHVLVDPVMVGGEVWTHDEQGLLFLLQNNPRFVRVFDKEGYMVYRFVG